jgi:hypothetical protein
MSWIEEVGALLGQYKGASASAPPPNVAADFAKVAEKTPTSAISSGLAAAFRSESTPAFGDMISQLFAQSNSTQRAGILNQLIAAAGPTPGSGGALAGLSGLLSGSTVAPEQAQQVSADAVRQLADEAHKRNPSVIDKASEFYAQHPTLVKGLGAGALACYRRPGEQWTFYEIDSAVVQIARDRRFFTFVSDCAPDLPVVIGDARLTLGASPEKYDLIVLDAFSSDTIPVHLLTREAIQVYLRHLNTGGVILLHISNRYMELADVVAAVAAAENLSTLIRRDDRPQASPPDFKMNAEVAALARNPHDLGDLGAQSGWHTLKAPPNVRAWTDDYSNILGAIMRKQAERWHAPAWAGHNAP